MGQLASSEGLEPRLDSLRRGLHRLRLRDRFFLLQLLDSRLRRSLGAFGRWLGAFGRRQEPRGHNLVGAYCGLELLEHGLADVGVLTQERRSVLAALTEPLAGTAPLFGAWIPHTTGVMVG